MSNLNLQFVPIATCYITCHLWGVFGFLTCFWHVKILTHVNTYSIQHPPPINVDSHFVTDCSQVCQGGFAFGLPFHPYMIGNYLQEDMLHDLYREWGESHLNRSSSQVLLSAWLKDGYNSSLFLVRIGDLTTPVSPWFSAQHLFSDFSKSLLHGLCFKHALQTHITSKSFLMLLKMPVFLCRAYRPDLNMSREPLNEKRDSYADRKLTKADDKH